MLALGQPSPSSGVPGSAGCHPGTWCQGWAGRREARAKVVGQGNKDTAATWPCRGTGGQPQAERGSQLPTGAWGSRAGSPSMRECLEKEVYGAALSDANGLKPIKRDGFM